MIETKRLTKKYGDTLAVDDVSFRIEKGEIVGLLGHNGAGKTTIMKMITGFLEPSAGKICVDGLNIDEQRQAIQTKIGYLPENCPVYPEMTVVDYLEYTAALRGLDGEAAEDAIKYAITQTSLQPKALDVISTLSRGYRQRVGVAQAILTQPEILILDEPTNGLDPSQIQHMRELFTKLGKTATIIISTHILKEVEAVCDRVLIIRDGRLALDSTLVDLRRGQRLLLSVDQPIEPIKLRLNDISGLRNVELIHQQGQVFQYSLETENQENQALEAIVSRVAKQIVGAGYELYEIRQEVRDLETVFREINIADVIEGGEQAHAA